MVTIATRIWKSKALESRIRTVWKVERRDMVGKTSIFLCSDLKIWASYSFNVFFQADMKETLKINLFILLHFVYLQQFLPNLPRS